MSVSLNLGISGSIVRAEFEGPLRAACQLKVSYVSPSSRTKENNKSSPMPAMSLKFSLAISMIFSKKKYLQKTFVIVAKPEVGDSHLRGNAMHGGVLLAVGLSVIGGSL